MSIEEEVDKVIKVVAELARNDAIEECARAIDKLYRGTREPFEFEILAAVRALKDKP